MPDSDSGKQKQLQNVYTEMFLVGTSVTDDFKEAFYGIIKAELMLDKMCTKINIKCT